MAGRRNGAITARQIQARLVRRSFSEVGRAQQSAPCVSAGSGDPHQFIRSPAGATQRNCEHPSCHVREWLNHGKAKHSFRSVRAKLLQPYYRVSFPVKFILSYELNQILVMPFRLDVNGIKKVRNSESETLDSYQCFIPSPCHTCLLQNV